MTSAHSLQAAPGEEKILAESFKGATVFVVMGASLLILQSVIIRLLSVPKARNRDGVHGRLHALWTWLPLLLGSGILASNLPRIAGAPHALVMLCDALGFLLALAGAVWALQLAHRARVRRNRPSTTT
ncbi:hypothetical protein [Streptacidiphilus rugosus]|uniref:hypothetical protein n=1 Tax=Streptacidiphilus rugosus TaxID=405783 RepID=UPI0005643CBC|nr:hypothetical protein [Streptacidiphilus rugosus]